MDSALSALHSLQRHERTKNVARGRNGTKVEKKYWKKDENLLTKFMKSILRGNLIRHSLEQDNVST